MAASRTSDIHRSPNDHSWLEHSETRTVVNVDFGGTSTLRSRRCSHVRDGEHACRLMEVRDTRHADGRNDEASRLSLLTSNAEEWVPSPSDLRISSKSSNLSELHISIGLQLRREKCSFVHKVADRQPNKRPKKGGGKGCVALLKSAKQLGCTFQDIGPPKFKLV